MRIRLNMRTTQKQLGEFFAVAMTFLYLTSMYIFSADTFGRYILLMATMGILLAAIYQGNGKLRISLDWFHLYMLLLILYTYLSEKFWSVYPYGTAEKVQTLTEIFIITSIYYLYYSKKESAWNLLSLMRWAGIIMVLYVFAFEGMSSISATLAEGTRLSSERVNANSLGLLAASAFTITAYEWLFQKKKLVALIACIPCIVIIAASGSRKALVFAVLGILILLVLRFSGQSSGKFVLGVLITLAVAFVLYQIISRVEMFSGIARRMDGLISAITGEGKADSSAESRLRYNEVGWEQFLQTPILGIGIGSSPLLLYYRVGRVTYMHNNYVELLACGGIVGAVLYYWIHVYFLWIFWKDRKSSDPVTKLCLALLIIYLILDWGMVTYYGKATYFRMMIFFIQSQIIVRRRKHEAEAATEGSGPIRDR